MSDITKHKRENGEESKRTKFMRKKSQPKRNYSRMLSERFGVQTRIRQVIYIEKKTALSLVKENWEFYKLYRRIEDDDHRRIKNDHRKQGDTY